MKEKLLTMLVAFCMTGLFLAGFGFCGQEQKADITDKLIASTIKVLAKGYIKTANLEEIKKHNIDKIRRKDDARLHRQLEKIFAEIQGTPLEKIAGITPASTKEEIIARIERITRKELYDTVDEIPDYLIGQKVKAYFSEKGNELSDKKQDIITMVKALWSDLIKKAMPAPQPKP